MKQAIFLFAIVLFISKIYAQDTEPTQRHLRYLPNQQPSYFSSTDSNFLRPNYIMIGYHWNNDASVVKSVFSDENNIKTEQLFKVNGIDTIFYTAQVQNNANLIIQGSHDSGTVYSHCYGDEGILNARSMQFSPTMLIHQDDNPDSIIHKRPLDNTHQIFGFQSIRGKISNSGADYNYLIIDSTILINQTVLTEPWGIELLFRHNKDDNLSSPIKDIWKDYYGFSFYVTINLKRKFPVPFSGTNPVLEIKMPYKINSDLITQRYIRFDSISTNSKFIIQPTVGAGRGWATNTTSAGTPTTSFIITENMLPIDGTPVTITAHFRCFGITELEDPLTNILLRNHRLSTMYSKEGAEIQKLGLTVDYKGSVPVKIGWVKLETPHAQQLYRGK